MNFLPFLTFHSFNTISVDEFLNSFKQICDTDELLEGAIMGLFHFSLDNILSVVRNAPHSAEHIDEKLGQLTSNWVRCLIIYPQVVNFLLKICATDEARTETYFKTMCIAKLWVVMPLDDTAELAI